MSCHFGRGVVVGSLVGAFAAMKWGKRLKNCPVYQKMEDIIFEADSDNNRERNSQKKCYRPYWRQRYHDEHDL